MASEDTTPNTARREITVRRAPKFVPFMILGAVVGAIVAAIIAYGRPADPAFDAGTVFGFFLICLLYTSPSPRDGLLSRMPSSA